MKTSICIICSLALVTNIFAAQVLYYDFNAGSGTTVADGAGTTSGTIMGTAASASWVAGKYGSGIKFSGNNYVTVPFKFPDNGSVALWFKPDSMYNYNTIFDNSLDENRWELWIQGDAPNPQPSWYSCAHCIKFRTGLNDAGKTGFDLSQNNTIPNSQITQTWYHIAATWTNAGVSKLYLNGVLVDTRTSPDFVAAGNTIYLGANKNPVAISATPSGNPRARGVLDDFRIYNTVLSATEMLAVYNTATSVQDFVKAAQTVSRVKITRRGDRITFSSIGSSIQSVNVLNLMGRHIGSAAVGINGVATVTVPHNQTLIAVLMSGSGTVETVPVIW